MKRLVLSVVGGFVIPFVYTIAVGPLSNYIENYRLRRLLGYPIRWPILLIQRVAPFNSFPYRDGDQVFAFLLVIVCDVLLYSLVTYILLWRFWKPKIQAVEPPPTPPRFQSSTN